MQEGDLNDSFNRMRLQLLRDGQLSQMQQRQQQQGSSSTSQGLGLDIQPDLWGSNAAPPGQGQNAWGAQLNSVTQTPGIGGPSREKHSPTAPSNPQGPGTSDAWTAAPDNHVKAESPQEQNDSSLWSGSPFGGISRSIWSGGVFQNTTYRCVQRVLAWRACQMF